MRRLIHTLLFGACVGTIFPVAAADPAPLKAEDFFTRDTIREANVSPSGRWLSLVGAVNGEHAALTIIDLDGKEPPRIIAKLSKFDITNVRWINDDWLVFGTFDETDRSGRSPNGSGLVSVRRDGEKLRELIKRRYDTEFPPMGGILPLEPDNHMLARGAPGSNDIIIGQEQYDPVHYEYTHTTLRLQNVTTGANRVYFRDRPAPPGRITSWLFDSLGQPRVAEDSHDGRFVTWWADPVSGAWKQIAAGSVFEPSFTPAYVDDQNQLFVTAPNAQTSLQELHRFDFTTGKPNPAVEVALPGFDVDPGPISDPGSDHVYGVRLLTDSASVAWFDPRMQAIQAKADALLPGRVNTLYCRPCSAPHTVLVVSYADTNPGDLLVYRPATDKFERLGAYRPGLDEARMANLELFRTKTRDGADLPVWITRNDKLPGPRPAVVLVHGGPWVRGTTWNWDPEAQFLASRGWVVIEPEFRGSTGFGENHFRAGWKQWGQRMQDDVTDALHFAVGKGWVDEKRVCIAGASYGGYAALMGVAKDPAQYKCAVAWVAVTDPRLLLTAYWSDMSDQARNFSMPELLGDPEKDKAMLIANSPLEQAAKIKVPVLLAYGSRDRRVPIAHGLRMREAMTAAGNPPQWIEYDNEGHGWFHTDNRLDFWRRVDAFLQQNLR